MKEDKDQQRKVSTCLEDSPCAEMMQRIMGEQGIGSLCEEMMRSLTETCRAGKESQGEVNQKEIHKEEGHGKKD